MSCDVRGLRQALGSIFGNYFCSIYMQLCIHTTCLFIEIYEYLNVPACPDMYSIYMVVYPPKQTRGSMAMQTEYGSKQRELCAS